ncbi:MAG: hypothetical protein ACYS47_12495 [Planctomycetota bacterium]|jgi:hypothetical protein
MTLARVLSLLTVALILASCSTERIYVHSNPPGCRVSVEGFPQYAAITPGSLELPVGRDYTLVCEGPDGRTATEVIRWTHVHLIERLGITVVLTPACALLGGGLIIGGIYGGSGEALAIGAILLVATPFIPIAYIFDSGYFEHPRPRSPTEGPGRSNLSFRSSIHFDFGGP